MCDSSPTAITKCWYWLLNSRKHLLIEDPMQQNLEQVPTAESWGREKRLHITSVGVIINSIGGAACISLQIFIHSSNPK